MYAQALRSRDGLPRARGNAIQARKCVATTGNASCFDANVTISSTASTAATSVVVVSPLSYDSDHSEEGITFAQSSVTVVKREQCYFHLMLTSEWSNVLAVFLSVITAHRGVQSWLSRLVTAPVGPESPEDSIV